MQTLAVFGNPRRKSRKSGKRRSAAQRAATARMLAANRRGRPAKRRARRRTSVVSSAPARRSVRRMRRSARRSFRRMSSGFRASGILGMLKNGAIMGGGAVAVDAIMGQVAPMLPASMQTPVDTTTGGVNYGYVAAKAGIAIAVGHFGRKVLPGYADKMAEGALAVLAYSLIRPMVSGSLTLGRVGNFNPAPTMRPRLSGVNAYVSGVNAYSNVRRLAPATRGATAAQAMNAINITRRAIA